MIYEVKRLKFYKVGVIPKEGWALPRTPNLLYNNDKDLKVFSCDAQLMSFEDSIALVDISN